MRAGDKILALCESGDLLLFEASTEKFKELARSKILDRPTRAGFALSDGKVLARDAKKLICVAVK